MLPRMYHHPYCSEIMGITAAPGLSTVRAYPEGHFSRSAHHITDTRLEPTVIDISACPLSFDDVKRGDVVEVILGVETHYSGKASATKPRVGLHLVVRSVVRIQCGREAEEEGQAFRPLGSLPEGIVVKPLPQQYL